MPRSCPSAPLWCKLARPAVTVSWVAPPPEGAGFAVAHVQTLGVPLPAADSGPSDPKRAPITLDGGRQRPRRSPEVGGAAVVAGRRRPLTEILLRRPSFVNSPG